MRTVEKIFPERNIGIGTQSGIPLSDREQGVKAVLIWRDGALTPHRAEVMGASPNSEYHLEIGLLFEGYTLSDFDGVTTLPKEVIEMIKEAGLLVDNVIEKG